MLAVLRGENNNCYTYRLASI